jgi:hypothetical protein
MNKNTDNSNSRDPWQQAADFRKLLFEAEEVERGVKEICEELDECQKLTGEDMSVRIQTLKG